MGLTVACFVITDEEKTSGTGTVSMAISVDTNVRAAEVVFLTFIYITAVISILQYKPM